MLFWYRGWMAAQDTAEVYKDHPIRVAVLTVVIDAAAALGTYAVHQAAWAVAAAIVAGTIAVIIGVFLWALVTQPRRELDVRVEALEQALEGIQNQLNSLVRERYGEPMQFLRELSTSRNQAGVASGVDAGEGDGESWLEGPCGRWSATQSDPLRGIRNGFSAGGQRLCP